MLSLGFTDSGLGRENEDTDDKTENVFEEQKQEAATEGESKEHKEDLKNIAPCKDREAEESDIEDVEPTLPYGDACNPDESDKRPVSASSRKDITREKHDLLQEEKIDDEIKIILHKEEIEIKSKETSVATKRDRDTGHTDQETDRI